MEVSLWSGIVLAEPLLWSSGQQTQTNSDSSDQPFSGGRNDFIDLWQMVLQLALCCWRGVIALFLLWREEVISSHTLVYLHWEACVPLDALWGLLNCSEIKCSKVLVGQVAVKRYSSFLSGLTDVLADTNHKLDALTLPLVKTLSTYICKETKKTCVALCCMSFLSSLPASHAHTGSSGCFGPPLGATTGWLQIPGIAAVIWVP